MDGGNNRHAGPQQMRRVLTGIETDADRNALHDLHVVARRVVGWQQAESRARCRGQTLNLSIERLITVGISTNRDGLARTDMLDLRLLEVRGDPYALERNQRHHRLPGLNLLTDFHGLLADGAFRWRLDCRVIEIQFGLLDDGAR